MHVHWLIPGDYTPDKLRTSPVASIRMRAGLFASHMNNSAMTATFGDAVDRRSTVMVIGKIGADCEKGRAASWLHKIKEARDRNCRIILDYTDDHLSIVRSPMRTFYQEVLPLADVAAASSEQLGRTLGAHFSGPVHIVTDPLEVPVVPPRNTALVQRPKLLWFGHPSNLGYLVNFLEDRKRCDAEFHLTILSNREGYKLMAARPPRPAGSVTLEFRPWSIPASEHAAREHDACIIPSDPDHPRKQGASSNRLITALALGLPTSADVLSSYRPYSQYFHDIRQTPVSGFIGQLEKYRQLTAEFQQRCLAEYQPEFIAKQWVQFFETVAANAGRVSTAASDG